MEKRSREGSKQTMRAVSGAPPRAQAVQPGAAGAGGLKGRESRRRAPGAAAKVGDSAIACHRAVAFEVWTARGQSRLGGFPLAPFKRIAVLGLHGGRYLAAQGDGI